MTEAQPGSGRRLRWLAAVAFVALAGLAAVVADARRRRADQMSTVELRQAAARLIGAPDLVLSSSSRWLRHPSLSEPGAPFSDAPATLDSDPAGGIIGPPISNYRSTTPSRNVEFR